MSVRRHREGDLGALTVDEFAERARSLEMQREPTALYIAGE